MQNCWKKLRNISQNLLKIINHDSSSFGFADVDGVLKKINKIQDNYNAISLVQDRSDGIWSMEATFQNKGKYGGAELDFGKGTLTFFINDVQQPIYFSGIREKVRFLVSMYHNGTSCTIKSLRKLSQPTVGQVTNMQAIQW
ncbi:MAG: hypothetical protein EZS28_039946 [Streblomastix strix]|uniref:Uncharacterized protein n=1 Tax=Streblomastix strix TaxID=222440 RepID=A0A5J4U2F3_9EUKA|nr:MAG: hypothetical protein EZS28_039946 [Streblomastix strix]